VHLISDRLVGWMPCLLRDIDDRVYGMDGQYGKDSRVSRISDRYDEWNGMRES